MLVGTDASTPLNFKTDAMWREMDLMVQYGVPPMEVLATATRRNADYMKMGHLVGTITRGKLADIIVIDGNPLVSMRDLRNVVAVVKDGRVYKGDDDHVSHDFDGTGRQQAAAVRCVMRIWITSLIAVSVDGADSSLSVARGQTLGSSIVGVVRDQTGGVLPGVTVEISSPALIGGVQSVVTDVGGQYRVVDLRPGTYSDLMLVAGFPDRARRRRRAPRGVHGDGQR